MSDSASTRTKTVTESADTGSTDVPLIADRWTNNISYRQLVMSSCSGILQLWWHPYLHDLRKLVPFLFLYNLFSVFIGYPVMYLELAIGVVTKKGVLNCWDMAPMARGIGFAMIICCAFTVLSIGVVSAWCLAHVVHSAHSFLPWLHCAAEAWPACAARHRPLTRESETPAQSFFFNFVLKLKRDALEGGLGNVVWELTVYYAISWALVYFVAVKRVYSYSKLVLFKDVLAYFVVLCGVVGSARLDGAGRMFTECEWSVLFEGTQMWREAIEYALIEMTVSQGSLIMLGAYCPPQKHKLSTTALLAFVASKASCMGSALILGATHGALKQDYDGNNTNIWSGPASSVVLWADFVARVPGSQFWSGLVFFSLFVLSISFVALMIQTIMSTFTGRSIRHVTWACLIAICLLFCFIGVITLCTQGGLYILTFLMDWPVTKPRVAIAAALAFTITYLYGQTTFCEEVFFAVGEYPCVFVRICWALSPMILMISFLTGMGTGSQESLAGWLTVTVTLFPIAVVLAMFLIFKCRVRNIVRNEK